MKASFIIAFAFLLFGCKTSTPHGAPLSAERAQMLAVQLANDKASTVYHCQAFGTGQPAHFEQGRWLWTDQRGRSFGDIEATVQLAANGSTNSVDLRLLDSRGIPSRF